jgi:hypothetical protein
MIRISMPSPALRPQGNDYRRQAHIPLNPERRLLLLAAS